MDLVFKLGQLAKVMLNESLSPGLFVVTSLFLIRGPVTEYPVKLDELCVRHCSDRSLRPSPQLHSSITKLKGGVLLGGSGPSGLG